MYIYVNEIRCKHVNLEQKHRASGCAKYLYKMNNK